MAEPDDGVLTGLLLAFRDFAQPVIDACASPEAMEFFWYRHGWRISLDGGGLAQLDQVLPIGPVGRQLEQVADAVSAQRASGGTPSLNDVARLADAVARLAETLTALNPTSLANLAGPLGQAATWEDLGEQLFDTLLEQYLREHHPIAYLILLVSGCLRYEARPAAEPIRVDFVRAVFDWEQPRALLHDPVAALAQTYHWDDPAAPFDHERLLDVLGRVLRPLGVETDLITPALQLEPGLPAETVATIRTDIDALRATVLHGVALDRHITYEVGFDVLPAGPAAGGPPSGLVLRPRLKGGVTQAIPIGAFTLTMAVGASVGDALGVSLFPRDAHLTGGDVTAGTSIELATSGADPFYLVGTAGSARIELRNPSIRMSLEGTADKAELRLRIGTAAGPSGGSQPGARVVIPMSQSDSFVRDSVGSSDIQISFSPEVIWSSATGFAVNGSPTPKIDLPLSIKVGSFTLRNATIALTDATTSGGRPAYQLSIGTDVAGSIGPVTAVVQGLGFAVQLVPYTRADLLALPPGASRPALGNLDVDFGFKPPTGLGLSFTAPVVSGGGFLSCDPDAGRYTGALHIKIADTIDIAAWGVLQTGSATQHWSLVVILAGHISPVELGWGFRLTGLGGLLALHRRMDTDALRDAASGVRGSLDDLLFPDDPVARLPQLLSSVERFFPPAANSYVAGPMAEIEWGPQLEVNARIRLAILLQLDAEQVALYGTVRIGFPSVDDDSTLRIRAGIEALVDLRSQMARFSITLIEAKLFGTIQFTGGAAFFVRWGADRQFALTIGGFHPAFRPYIPAGLIEPPRVGVHWSPIDGVRLDLTQYFAITSTSMQFGASAHAEVGCSWGKVTGDLAFDLLVMTSPSLYLEADLHARVTVSVFGADILSAGLDGSLSGPGPWVFAGRVTWRVWIFGISKGFHFEWGDHAAPPAVPQSAGQLLAAEMQSAANWTSFRSRALPVKVRTGVSAPLAPRDEIEVRQSRLPFATRIETMESNPLSDPGVWTLTTISAGSITKLADLTEVFPEQRFLAEPSRERPFRGGLVCGARLGRADWDISTVAVAVDSTAVDDIVLDSDTTVAGAVTLPPPTAADAVAFALSATAPARAFTRDASVLEVVR